MPAVTHGLGSDEGGDDVGAAVGVGVGPGPRRGARVGRPAVSLYARDTDENLPEWMVYLEG